MPSSEVLKDKFILIVDDEQDVLDIIGEELSSVPNLTVNTATTFEKGREYLVSYTYDLVVLDIMGVRGFDLLKIAANANFPVVMLTAHALNPEALKQSIELGARAYLPKDKLGSIDPVPGRCCESELSVGVEEGTRSRDYRIRQTIRI